jgi:hypothetical protein
MHEFVREVALLLSGLWSLKRSGMNLSFGYQVVIGLGIAERC